MDVGRRLPDFYHYQPIRMLHIHFQMMVPFQNPAAQLPADFRRLHGERFVRPLGLYFKGGRVFQFLAQKIQRILTDILKILGGHPRPAERRDAEHVGYPPAGFVQVDIVRLGLAVNRGLRLAELELSQAVQPPLCIFDQHIFERGFI